MSRSPRDASADDAAALARIARDALPEAWSEGSIRASLARPGACALLIDPELGFALGWRAGGEAEILTLAVEKAARGQGLGRALAVALLARFRADGARRVSLEVRGSNSAALRLYGSLGFTRTRVRPRYYRDGEDALVLGAEL
ncbi:MAG: ribosomal protein S18-alanine N-acetyltransferase [Myxococcota bacterium]